MGPHHRAGRTYDKRENDGDRGHAANDDGAALPGVGNEHAIQNDQEEPFQIVGGVAQPDHLADGIVYGQSGNFPG